MFTELMQDTKDYILSQGKVEFSPAVKWKAISTVLLYLRYEMNFVYHTGQKDELGRFLLTLKKGCSYKMAHVEFTAKCGNALKMFMLELITKTAIKEAEINDSDQLELECDDPLIVDVFLRYNFKIRKIDQLPTYKPLWNGTKEITQVNEHPLSSMALGMGTL